MALSLLMTRSFGGGLQPVNDAGREMLTHIGKDEMVEVVIKRPRNLGHHKKFFALLSLIFENQTRYPTVEDLLDAIKVHIGHCSTITLKDGREVYVPKSISFAAMDQTEFEQFWNRVVTVICEQIIPGMNRADLEREILELVR